MSEGGDGVIEELCGDEKALNETQVMVNIIKVKDQEEITKYALAVVWGMFPTLESKVYLTGKCWVLPNQKSYRDSQSNKD